MADLTWNNEELAVFLDAVQRAVLYELVPQVEALAFTLAPVEVRRTPVPSWARHHHPGRDGRLKASVHSEVGRNGEDWHGDIIALWYGRFMDPKARQLHRRRPFLPTALYTVCQGRVLHFG